MPEESKSKAREGFDRLLEKYPLAEVAEVWNQEMTVAQAEHRHRTFQARVIYRQRALLPIDDGPWLCVDLMYAGRLERFAIWRSTGNVYRLDAVGAVEDDPFIVITVPEHI